MKRNKIAAGLFTAFLFVAGGATAASAQYPGGGPATTTTQPGSELPVVTVVRGQTITVTGKECGAGDLVTITYDDGTKLGTVTAGADGTFTTQVTIPTNSTLGEHVLTATCPNGADQILRVNVVANATTPPPATGGGSALPRTGSDTAPLVGIGAAAVVLGGAFVYGARRPRNA